MTWGFCSGRAVPSLSCQVGLVTELWKRGASKLGSKAEGLFCERMNFRKADKHLQQQQHPPPQLPHRSPCSGEHQAACLGGWGRGDFDWSGRL